MDKSVPDQFAAIALQPDRSTRPELQPIPPLPLPETRLESRVSDGLGAPPPAARMRTPEDMRARMAELRAHYAPFLENHTPPLPFARPRLDLREFEFRFEEPLDRADAQRPYAANNNMGRSHHPALPRAGRALGSLLPPHLQRAA